MKRYLFTVILFVVCAVSNAQSLTFEELLNLTGMTDEQANYFLTVSKGFKSTGLQVLNGKNEYQYKSNSSAPGKTETVTIDVSTNNTGAKTLRVVTYNTLQEQDINNLLAEAKKSSLTIVFQGSDANKNIYRFDNSLFRASISLSIDKKYGSVEVQQR